MCMFDNYVTSHHHGPSCMLGHRRHPCVKKQSMMSLILKSFLKQRHKIHKDNMSYKKYLFENASFIFMVSFLKIDTI